MNNRSVFFNMVLNRFMLAFILNRERRDPRRNLLQPLSAEALTIPGI